MKRFVNIINLIIIIFIILTWNKVNAFSYGDVIINEINWGGSSLSSSDEWIELKNNSNSEINLNGWKISGAGSGDNSLQINGDYKIGPNEYFLISNFNLGDSNCAFTIVPDIILTSISLLNSNNGNLELIDSDNNLVDEVKGDIWPAGNNDPHTSMERILKDGLLDESWQSASNSINIISNFSDKGTPGAENSPPIFNNISSNYPEFSDYLYLSNMLEAEGKINKIIDGDTIELEINNIVYKARLMGIDAPESAYSSQFNVNEPYYLESKEYLKNYFDKNIKLFVPKINNDRYDNYNRLLVIAVFDEYIINVDSILNGLSKSYYLDNNYLVKQKWESAEYIAKTNLLNIWKYFSNSCIKINEILPNPSGEDTDNEFIELRNICEYELDLYGWIIDDGDYGSSPYMIDDNFIISPKSYFTIYSNASKITLNNDSDNVRLFTPDYNLSDEISYEDTNENESYSLISNDWLFTDNLSPNKENIMPSNSEKIVKNISDLKTIEKGETLQVQGIVNSLPGTIGSQYFYIEDSSAGTQIYSYNQVFPDLKLGDFISVVGELSTTSYLRLKIYNLNDILLISSNNELKPKIISSATIKNNIGKLVQIQGKITKKSSQTLYIGDENNSNIKINIRSSLGFKSGNFDEGDIIEIVGIVVEDSSNITISPRSINDIIIISKSNDNYSISLSDRIIDVINLPDNTVVKLKGIVINLPNNFSSQYFYIMDDSYGIQIYSYNKLFPSLSIGDEIEVIGKISSSGRRLKIYDINDIKITSKQNLIVINYLDNNIDTYYGRLIYIEGTLVEKKGLNIIIENNGQRYNIYLKSKTNIKSSAYKVGNYIKIIGIVELLSGVYKIVPRYENDIINYSTQKAKLANTVTYTKKLNSEIKIKNNLKSQKYLNKIPKKVYNTLKINIVKSIIVVLVLNLICILLYLFYEKIIHSNQIKSSQNC